MNIQVNKYINNYCKCTSRTKENNLSKENVEQKKKWELNNPGLSSSNILSD